MNDLGIMICESNERIPFKEKSFYRRLCKIGMELGIHVFVFSPLRINWYLHQVSGYTFDKKTKSWIKKWFPIPSIIYDRCFFTHRHSMRRYHSSITKLRKAKQVIFLGVGLQGKWTIQQALLQNDLFKAYLPYTELSLHTQHIMEWLNHKKEAILKPQSGSQGRGVLHITKHTEHRYHVRGRDQKNQLMNIKFDKTSNFKHWIHEFIAKRKYIIQEYLSLTTAAAESFDIRSLMQKNYEGHWQHTGMAIRRGAPGSVTSNLHGGGSAEEVFPFLKLHYSEKIALEIQSTIHRLSKKIPPHLEQQCGRLFELGIDFGVDQQGKVWILEVNSKPGRAVFRKLHNLKQKKLSVYNPIHYARYILDRQLGG